MKISSDIKKKKKKQKSYIIQETTPTKQEKNEGEMSWDTRKIKTVKI